MYFRVVVVTYVAKMGIVNTNFKGIIEVKGEWVMNYPKAQIHDEITFNRFDQALEGVVMKRYENSVIVKLTEESYHVVKENLPNDLTVVNDKNYKILYQANENRELA